MKEDSLKLVFETLLHANSTHIKVWRQGKKTTLLLLHSYYNECQQHVVDVG